MSTHSRKGAGQSKLGRLMIAGPLVGLMSVPALAGPEGEQVVHGSAQFTRQGNLTTITTSHRAIINYSSFDLASWESVRFLQPNANSRVLNRIQSGVPTHIDGSITANGSVYFVNNAGIVFGPNAVLNVGSLFAAAGNISNRDFIDGRNRFTDLTGDVVNHGRIEAGQVGLLGRRVANYGQIVAPEGVVTFGSGEEVFIGQRGSHVFARITSTDEGIDGGIEQGGSITAREVNLSVGDHFALATFDESDIRAQRVTIRGGDESTVTVSGSIDVTRQGDRGGRVDIFGDTILLNGASIDASGDLGGGVVRIGGDYQGQGLSPHARYTLVTPDTLIRADALVAGRGGRVIVWSDQKTVYGGFISARGGALGGDGGFVEVSGRDVLAYTGLADVRAVGGKAGKLLLDPKFITIESGPGGSWPAFGADNIIDFAEGVEETILHDADLAAQLDLLGAGGELLLQASTDIRFMGGSSIVSTGEGLLILEAGRRVRFGVGGDTLLDLGSGSLRVIANSDGYTPVEFPRDAGNGDIIMSSGSSIRSNGGTVELFLQNFGDSANINISTIDVGSGTVRAVHTGSQGSSNHHILQVAGGSGITAGSVELSATTGGGVGPTAMQRMIINADELSISTNGGNSFVSLTRATSITGSGLTTNGGSVDIQSTNTLDLASNLDAGVGTVSITASEIGTSGGSVTGSSVRLEATAGGIGADGAHLGVTTDLLAASSTAGVFLDTQSQGGGALTVGSIDGLSGISSATGTITLLHAGDLVLDDALTATGHGLSSDVIRVDASTVTIQGAGGVDAGVTGGMVFNTDSLTVDATFASALAGRAATFNVGAGGVDINATLTGFEDIAFDTSGQFNLNAGGRVDASSSLEITAASFDIDSGSGLRGAAVLTLDSTGGLSLSQAGADQLETTGAGLLTLRTQAGDLELAGWTAAFGTALQTVFDSSGRLVFNAGAPITYTFNELQASAGSGIEFGANVDGLSGSSLLLDAGSGAIDILAGSVFTVTGPIDLRSNVNATQAGGGVHFTGAIDATGGSGRLDLLTDTGGLQIDSTLTTGGRNVQLLTAGGTISVGGLVQTAGGNITVNLGAGTLNLAAGSTRLDAGAGRVALIADAWAPFDSALAQLIVGSELTVQATAGDVQISGPDAAFANFPTVRLVSENGLVDLLGTGTYAFDSVELLGANGVRFAAGVDGIAALQDILADGDTDDDGVGAVELLNPAAFTLSSAGNTFTLRSELVTHGDLTVIGPMVFDDGWISGGDKLIKLEGSFYGFGTGQDLVTTTGTLWLCGFAGDHTFWIGDDGQIVAASGGADLSNVLIGNTFLNRLNVGHLLIGRNTDLSLTSTLAAHHYSVAASELAGGVDPRIDLVSVYARDQITFNEQTSSFRDFAAHTGLNAGPGFGIIFRLSDAAQRVEALDGSLSLDAGNGSIFADDAFSGEIRLSSTVQSMLSADVTAANGLFIEGNAEFGGTQITTSGGEILVTGNAVLNGGDVTIITTDGGAAGANIGFAQLDVTAGGLNLAAGNGSITFGGPTTILDDAVIGSAGSVLSNGTFEANTLSIGAGAGASSIVFNDALTINGAGLLATDTVLELFAISPDGGATPGTLALNGLVTLLNGVADLGLEGDGAISSAGNLHIENAGRGIRLRSSASAANDLILRGDTQLLGTGLERMFDAGGEVRILGSLDLGNDNHLIIDAGGIDFRDSSDTFAGLVFGAGNSVLSLLPGDRTLIEVGSFGGAGVVESLHIDGLDIESLDASLALVEIGDAALGDADIIVGDDGGGGELEFAPALTLWAHADGREIHFLNGLTLLGAGDALTVNGSGDTTFLTGTITTNGGDVLLNDSLHVVDSAFVRTGGGDFLVTGNTLIDVLFDVDTTGGGDGLIHFGRDVFGAAAGTGSLVLDAGTDDVEFLGDIGRVIGLPQPMALVEVLNAGRVFFNGEGYEAVDQRYNAGGFFLTHPASGASQFTSHGGELTFTGGPIELANGTDLSIDAMLGGVVTLTDLLRHSEDGDAQVVARVRDLINFTNIGLDAERFALVDVIAGADGTPGHAVFHGTSFVDVYQLHADELDFLGGSGSVFGTEMNITQRDGARSIFIGGDGTDTTHLNLVESDIQALADGFTVVRIGDDTTDEIEVINLGDPALTILDPYELRAEGGIAVFRDISGTGDAALSFFTDQLTLLNADLTLQGGDVAAFNLAGDPGAVRIRETVNIMTGGGGVHFAGTVDGDPSFDDVLNIDAGDGMVALGLVGKTETLQGLDVLGGMIDIESIGAADKAGVTGPTRLLADDTLRFVGSIFNTMQAQYAARNGMSAEGDISFLTNDSELRFGQASPRGWGSLTLKLQDAVFSADSGSANTIVDGTYTGDRADMMFHAKNVVLNGETTIDNQRGTVDFDAAINGRNHLAVSTGNGTVLFRGVVGSDDLADRIRTLTVDAHRIEFLSRLIHVDAADFTATRYIFDPSALILPEQSVVAEIGDLTFNGGIIRFFEGALNLNAYRGVTTLADLTGSNAALNLSVRGRDGVVLGGIGTSLGSGVSNVLIEGNELTLNSDIFFREAALVRPFHRNNVIRIGVDTVDGNDELEISQAMLDRFNPGNNGVLSIGAFAGSNDPTDPGFDVFGDTFSNSQIFVSSFTYANGDLSIIGRNVELLDGETATINGGHQLRISSERESRLDGRIVSDGGRVVVNGLRAILNSDILSNGGDIFIRSTAFVDEGANLVTLGADRDGDFIVTGGVEALVEGVGDFELNVGRGEIQLDPGAGIGQLRRLRSVSLTATRLSLSNVRTTHDQRFTGTDRLEVVGGELDSLFGDITFFNPLIVGGEQLVRVGGDGRILINEDVAGAGGKDENLTLVSADGATEFRGNVAGVDRLFVDGQAWMIGDRTFQGGEIIFNGLVDTTTKTSLLIEADSLAELARSVGTQGIFSTVEVSSGQDIVLGTSGESFRIDTCGLQSYDGHTFIRGDVWLQAHGFGEGPAREDSILFLGNVDGWVSGQDSLTAIVDRTGGREFELDGIREVPPTNVPIIGFDGSVGGQTRLGGLYLNFAEGLIDGRMDADGSFGSIVATIVFGDVDAFANTGARIDASINADLFGMGRGEALTAFGDLALNVGSARASDISTIGSLTFNISDTLTIVNRNASETFDTVTEQPTDDTGTDFVAIEGIFSSGGFTIEVDDEGVDSPGVIAFSAVAGNVNVSVPTSLGNKLQIRSLPANAQELFLYDSSSGAGAAVLSPQFIALDVRAEGPSNTNIAEALAGAVQTADSGEVSQGALVPSTVREVLEQLGLDPRDYPAEYLARGLTEAAEQVAETMLSALQGSALYVDTPDYDGDSAAETSLERLDKKLTMDVVLGQYITLWYGVRDEQGNVLSVDPSGPDASRAMQEAFEQVLADCRAYLRTAEDVPAEEWVRFLNERADQYPLASTYLRELQALFDGLRLMGLSRDEINRVWTARLEITGIIPSGIDMEGLRRIITGDQVLLAVDNSDNGKEPIVDVDQ